MNKYKKKWQKSRKKWKKEKMGFLLKIDQLRSLLTRQMEMRTREARLRRDETAVLEARAIRCDRMIESLSQEKEALIRENNGLRHQLAIYSRGFSSQSEMDEKVEKSMVGEKLLTKNEDETNDADFKATPELVDRMNSFLGAVEGDNITLLKGTTSIDDLRRHFFESMRKTKVRIFVGGPDGLRHIENAEDFINMSKREEGEPLPSHDLDPHKLNIA